VQAAEGRLVKEHFLGATARKVVPAMSEAASLGMERKVFQAVLLESAAIALYGSRAHLEMYCGFVRQAIADKVIEPLVSLTNINYDESSFVLRHADFAGRKTFIDLGSLRLLNKAMAKQIKDESMPAHLPLAMTGQRGAFNHSQGSSLCKVTQSEGSVLFAFRVNVTDEIHILHFPLLMPLQLSDRCTSETNVALITEQLFIRGLDELRFLFPYNVDLSCADSSAANEKGEAIMEATGLFPRLHARCEGHRAHSVQARAYEPITQSVSDFVAFILAQSPAGAVDQLRDAVIEILEFRCVHINGSPPNDSHPLSVRRDALIDLCVDVRDTARRYKLQTLLTSELDDRTPFWLVPQLTADVHQWAVELGYALVPRKMKLFKRACWISSAGPLKEMCLLTNVFHLYEDAIPRWVEKLKGKTPGLLTT